MDPRLLTASRHHPVSGAEAPCKCVSRGGGSPVLRCAPSATCPPVTPPPCAFAGVYDRAPYSARKLIVIDRLREQIELSDMSDNSMYLQ
jgi:hypothetical protein